MKTFGQRLGTLLRGGECLELVGDVGAGKTTFVKGLAAGLNIDEDVQSPSFTISRVYPARDSLSLQHYDFYRLSEPGVMSYELAESLAEPGAVTVVEWGESVADVLPADHIRLKLTYHERDEGRTCHLTLPTNYEYLKEAVQ